MNIDELKYDDNGLIPSIIQDELTGTVLMLAYMNQESLAKTLETGFTWFYSRSRQRLWQKGETSGHIQKVKKIRYDCDADTLLITVEQVGVACHEGTFTCFTKEITAGDKTESESHNDGILIDVLNDLYNVITERKLNPIEGSYTTYLFTKGQDKILKKVGEECAETIIGSKNNSKEEVIYEMADLWYHCLVLLANHDITLNELTAELKKRRK